MYTDPTGYDIANYDDWRNRDEARREITTTELMNLGTFDTWCASLDNWHFLDPDSQWGYNGRGNPLIDWERFNRRMEAAFADWNSRPGAGENGNGANGSYWDWRTGTYRSTSTWGAVSWEHVLATAVLPFAVEISISGFSALNSRNATMGEYINFATQLASNPQSAGGIPPELTAARDATRVANNARIPGLGGGGSSDGIWGIGDALEVGGAIKPNRVTPIIGWGITIYNAGSEIRNGQYVNAMWSLIEGAGGLYSVGAKSLYELSQTRFMQEGIGRIYYENYMINANMYYSTRNTLYLDRATHYENLMWKTYYNFNRPK